MLIGVISDTHGRLDPRVHEALSGVDRILHAGDVGSLEVLEALGDIAPVLGVYGNTDPLEVRQALARELSVEMAGQLIYLHHEPPLPGAIPPRTTLAVNGHTHVAKIASHGGVTLLNPGSASKPRSGSRSVALVELAAGRPPAPRIVRL